MSPKLLIALALAMLASCADISRRATSFASEPPGARVLVDGHDSGWVTPCAIDLDAEVNHTVTFALAGHAPSTLELGPWPRLQGIDWYLGVNGVKSPIHFPIFLPTQDFLIPFRQSTNLAPGRVFVRLRPERAP